MDWKVFFIILSPIAAALLSFLLTQWWERRPKLLVYLGHVANLKIRTVPETDVYTHSIILRNSGRRSAKNIHIGHQNFPQHYAIVPNIDHQIKTVTDSADEIFIPNLVPGEQVTISYLYTELLTVNQIHGAIKFDEGFAKYIEVIPTQQYSKNTIAFIRLLLILGLGTLIYGLWELLIFIKNF